MKHLVAWFAASTFLALATVANLVGRAATWAGKELIEWGNK